MPSRAALKLKGSLREDKNWPKFTRLVKPADFAYNEKTYLLNQKITCNRINTINAWMEKSTQCLAYREEMPQIESVSKRAELPKFTPEQFPEFRSSFLEGDSRGNRPQTVISVRVR